MGQRLGGTLSLGQQDQELLCAAGARQSETVQVPLRLGSLCPSVGSRETELGPVTPVLS